MRDVLVQSAGVFFYSLAIAWLEIQIEGADGWAAKLPTWRKQPAWASERSWFFRALRAVFRFSSGGNELTGYHLTMILTVFASMMLPLLMTTPTTALFLRCLGFFFLTLVTWDFLWFVWNPAYGVRRFHKRAIAWHPRWVGPVPASYPAGLVLGGVCIALSLEPHAPLWAYVCAPLVEIGLCAVSIAIAPASRA